MLGSLPAGASPTETYVGAHWTTGNIPAGCQADRSADNPYNRCFHEYTLLNPLDTPKIDVALVLPFSATAERDARIMRQAVEMWSGGIEYLSGQLGLDWLRKGVDIQVTTDIVSPDVDKALTLRDPEIVVIATNAVGLTGIGVDPISFLTTDEEGVEGRPCVQKPDVFSLDAWLATPGFDDHHGTQGGTYVDHCEGGVGGTTCFAVNAATDPLAGALDTGVRQFSPFTLFDLVAHEVGHCLSLGHVGDGADGPWGLTPTTDPMAYSTDPPGRFKCASTLNVETFALMMSRLIDRNGDGKVDKGDYLAANNIAPDGPYQVMHPAEYSSASSTGDPYDCPQPDVGLTPGAQTDWVPEPVATKQPALSVSTMTRGDRSLVVAGKASWLLRNPPRAVSGSVADPDSDAPVPFNDILGFTASVTSTHVDATVKLKELAPVVPQAGSPSYYAIVVSGRMFTSAKFLSGAETVTYDEGASETLPPGSSTWDTATSTVRFHIPRSYLDRMLVAPPYKLAAASGTQMFLLSEVSTTTDDWAPDSGRLALAAPPFKGYPVSSVAVKDDRDRDRVPDAKDRCRSLAGDPYSAGCPDTDADTVIDPVDQCPRVAGTTEAGCPQASTERVVVFVNDKKQATQYIVTRRGSGDYRIEVPMPAQRPGVTYRIKIVWYGANGDLAQVIRTSK